MVLLDGVFTDGMSGCDEAWDYSSGSQACRSTIWQSTDHGWNGVWELVGVSLREPAAFAASVKAASWSGIWNCRRRCVEKRLREYDRNLRRDGCHGAAPRVRFSDLQLV